MKSKEDIQEVESLKEVVLQTIMSYFKDNILTLDYPITMTINA